MSFQAMATASRYKARNPGQKLLLLMIANYADEDGVAYPSQARLAADCSMDVGTVSRHLAELEKIMAISREQRRRDNGSRSTDRITLLIGGPRKMPGSPPDQPGILQGCTEQGGPPQKQGDQNLSPEPVEDSLGVRARKWAEVYWAEAPARSKKRSTSLSETTRATEAMLKRGTDPARMREALRRYFTDPEILAEDGRVMAGVHRLIQNDKALSGWDPGAAWHPPQAGADGMPPPLPIGAAPGPAQETALLGTMAEPGPVRQARWMEDYADTGSWPGERGPPPGAPGCRVSPELQRAHLKEDAR